MASGESWNGEPPAAPARRAAALAGSLPRGTAHFERLAARLAALRGEREDDPVANPVERLGYEISRDIDTGRLSLEDLDELVRTLALSGYLTRARRLSDYVGGAAVAESEARLRSVVRGLIEATTPADDGLNAFRAQAETPALGVVFTAHPTFSVPEALMEGIACLAAGSDPEGRPLDEAARAGLVARAARESHGHMHAPTLRDEQAQAGRAIRRCRAALDRAHRIVLEEARAAWPDRWTAIVPRLMTAASWTGYDLDGRIDVTWADILRARTDSAARMARHYAERLDGLAQTVAGPAADTVAGHARRAQEAADTLAGLSDLLARAHGDTDAARAVGRRLAAGGWPPLDTGEIERSLADLLPALGEEARIEAQLVRAEMRNFGLGDAHVHFRVNAIQLDNALRDDIGETDPAGAGGRRQIARLDGLLEAVEAKTVNIGSVVVEPTTARRMMMLASLIRRYIDPGQPIRFLIAECDAPSGVLSALYLARLFGVDDALDISPLFETRLSLQRGHELVADLLQNPHYRRYVARRGRLAVQTGYSDGGRAVGQATVALAIERLRVKIAQALAAAGLGEVELVIFDTHGESIGRGAHPGGMQARLDYVDTPHSRKVFAELGIRHVQEVSFQGGDGYVFFGNPAMALASLSTLLAHRLTPPAPAEDPFYANVDHALEVFLDMRAFNESLTGDPNYIRWLSTFASSVLPPSGSRAVSRPTGERKSVFDMRAIPHNAGLHQMGMLVNSLAGVGAALAPDVERAASLYRTSPRFRILLDLAAHARGLSSLDAMGAYIDLLNPVKWLRRAAVENEAGRRGERMRTVARLLARHGRYRDANAFMHRVFDDLLDLDRVLAGCDVATGLGAREVELDVMHAVRLTLARRILLLAAEVPTFAARPGFEPERVERDLVALDVPRAVAVLREMFPESPAVVVDDSFGAPATYRSDAQRGYHPLHETVFRPLETHHDLLRRVGAAITHQIGAFG